MQFQHPYLLLLSAPLIVLLVLLIRRDFVKFSREDRKVLARKRIFLLASRTLIFTLLIIAIASPFTLKTTVKQGDPSLTILIDNSSSMNVLDTEDIPSLITDLEKKLPLTVRTVATGTSSPLGDGVLAALRGNDNVLLVSDGNSNGGRSLGDAIVVASAMNSTINALNLDVAKDDTRVSISGPHVTTSAEENEFTIAVTQVGQEQPYTVAVYIDEQLLISEKHSGSREFTFSRKFTEGYHTLEATLDTQDAFSQNNVAYKSIKVESKPSILLVTKRATPFNSFLQSFYKTETVSQLPEHLNSYSAIVLNNIPAAELNAIALSNYVIEGNGLMAVGGKNSYDLGGYKDSIFENLLPVRVGRGNETNNGQVHIILLIDISKSTSDRFKTKSNVNVQEVEKALAIDVLNHLRKEDQVGVISFNTEAYLVSELVPLGGNKEGLTDAITNINYGGSTDISEALKQARILLGPRSGSKAIILFSDGKTQMQSEALSAAEGASTIGIRIYSIGVGEGTNRQYLQALARAGNGYYFEPTETERLKIIFDKSDSVSSSSTASTFPIQVFNNNHFITSQLKLSATVNGFNQVVPKPQADILVTTVEGHTLLSSWRIGLGRVASLSTDDGSAWSPQLLSSQNSVLLSKTVNWAIGDLSRNKEFDVDIKDGTLGNEMVVSVISSSLPEHESLRFSKVGKRLYTAPFTPTSAGFQHFLGATGAANREQEYWQLGLNPQLEGLIGQTGGKVFNSGDADALAEKVKEDSKRILSESVSHSWIFLLAALLIFLLEVSVRRIQEGRKT